MEGQNENDELYPIAVLIDELKVCILFVSAITPSDLQRSMTMYYYD